MTKHRPWVQQQNEEQRMATLRMALLPTGDMAEILFVGEDVWVVSLSSGNPSRYDAMLNQGTV